ncbi:MAG: DUF6314 family protein [Bacteroidota bacterium]
MKELNSKVEQNHRLFQFLKGEWVFSRTISSFGSTKGVGIFSPLQENHFHYQEEGMTTLDNGRELKSTQEYIYEWTGEQIVIWFSKLGKKDRPFHYLNFDMDFDNKRWESQDYHLCVADHYWGTYSFDQFGHFTIQYKVKGPKKDYVSTTLFQKK